MKIIWKSQAVLLACNFWDHRADSFLASHSFSGVTTDNMLLIPNYKSFGFCLLDWKTHTSANDHCKEVSPRDVTTVRSQDGCVAPESCSDTWRGRGTVAHAQNTEVGTAVSASGLSSHRKLGTNAKLHVSELLFLTL